MCIFWTSISIVWIAMEGSSDSTWQDTGFENDRDRAILSSLDNLKNQCDDVSLRHWLDKSDRHVDEFECLHIFKQIVEMVSTAHSQGVVVHNVRPSCFILSSFHGLSFIESASCSDSLETDGFLIVGSSTNTSTAKQGNTEEAGEEKTLLLPMKQVLLMETSWYTSPEEMSGDTSSCASDIYRLGILLFELFFPCNSRDEKSQMMSSLRHRVLPPQLLLKWPKEASFCLWLLHSEPTGRPKMSELLQSPFFNEPRENLEERKAASHLRETIEEQELLLEFLLIMHQRKQEMADKLQDTLSFLSSDIAEVKNHHTLFLKKLGNDNENQHCFFQKSSRLKKNIKKLESAYFMTRYRSIMAPPSSRQNQWIGPFLEGLCKYLSFSRFRVKADLQKGDLLNSSNLVCSLSFDRDGEYFASAGTNKKIKVFECSAVLKQDGGIHYPVVEMVSGSKLSSICWNTYIKSHIASSNFEGVVQVWDVSRNQVLAEMREHEKRVWSIDFSSADPTMLASGSDDCSVKLWSINQGVSIGSIQLKSNVCSVQFPSDSSRTVAFGSADHKVYYYDLRNCKSPLCTLTGHNKTVSYVKFVDSSNLVSASTDNTLKLWDLSTCSSRVLDTPIQSYTGHTNVKVCIFGLVSRERRSCTDLGVDSWFYGLRGLVSPFFMNFVGLSVSDGYIATGSETNEVFVYHKAFPMPALLYRFSSRSDLSPRHKHELDDADKFISSVCWKGQSSTLIAANSTGNIKILEMV